MIQAKLIELALKALFKTDVFKSLIDYKDKPNSADLAVQKVAEELKAQKVKHDALIGMVKGFSGQIDKIENALKPIKSAVGKFEDQIKIIEKIAHPPAISTKDINELKEKANQVTEMAGWFKKMKKITILKSIFK